MFKPGDRVRSKIDIIAPDGSSIELAKGTKGTVMPTRVISKSYPYSVDFEGHDPDFPMKTHEIELDS